MDLQDVARLCSTLTVIDVCNDNFLKEDFDFTKMNIVHKFGTKEDYLLLIEMNNYFYFVTSDRPVIFRSKSIEEMTQWGLTQRARDLWNIQL